METPEWLSDSSKVFLANCWNMAIGFERPYTTFFFSSAYDYLLESVVFSYTVG